jgi:hypothetical protein
MAVDLLDRPTASPSRSGPRPPCPPWPPRPPTRRLRDLLRRPPRAPAPIGDPTAVRILLQEARTVVQRGWVQHAWYVARDRRGRPRPIGPYHLGRFNHADVTAACLVGAVLQAERLHRPAAERGTAGAAVDLLWHALRTPAGAVSAARSPAERASRARDLSRWNDAAQRRQEDVLALFDEAVLRTPSVPAGRQTTSV